MSNTLAAITSARELTNRAFFASKAGRLDKAFCLLEEALSVCPQHAPAHSQMATVLMKQKKIIDALPHAEQAVTLAPQRAQYRSNLIHLLFEWVKAKNTWGEVECALKELRQHMNSLLEAFPHYASAFFMNAELLALEGHPQSRWENELDQAVSVLWRTLVDVEGLPNSPAAIVEDTAAQVLVCHQTAAWRRRLDHARNPVKTSSPGSHDAEPEDCERSSLSEQRRRGM